jgi:hypothetical protein
LSNAQICFITNITRKSSTNVFQRLGIESDNTSSTIQCNSRAWTKTHISSWTDHVLFGRYSPRGKDDSSIIECYRVERSDSTDSSHDTLITHTVVDNTLLGDSSSQEGQHLPIQQEGNANKSPMYSLDTKRIVLTTRNLCRMKTKYTTVLLDDQSEEETDTSQKMNH